MDIIVYTSIIDTNSQSCLVNWFSMLTVFHKESVTGHRSLLDQDTVAGARVESSQYTRDR